MQINADLSASFFVFIYQILKQIVEVPPIFILLFALSVLFSLMWASALTANLLGAASLAVAGRKGALRFLGRVLLFYLAISLGFWIGLVSDPSRLFAVDLTEGPLFGGDLLRLGLPLALFAGLGLFVMACLSLPQTKRLFRSFPEQAPPRKARLLLHAWALGTIFVTPAVIILLGLAIVASGEDFQIVFTVAAFYFVGLVLLFGGTYAILWLLRDRRSLPRRGEPPAWLLLPSHR